MKYLTVILLALSACSPAKSDPNVRIDLQIGPQGERCYVFSQDGRAFSGHCER